jgi:hypothetical protein
MDADDQRKVDFAKDFLKENFSMEDFDDSFLDIEIIDTKSFVFFLVTFLVDYLRIYQPPKEKLSTSIGTIDSPLQEKEIPEEIIVKEKFKSLEVEDIFLLEELTSEDVQFIEKFLQKTNVDLEAEVYSNFIISTSQMIYLIRKIIQEYRTFLSNRKMSEKE